MRALIEAAARIVETEGLEGLNTNRVAEVAGVGIGSLYQYFPSKEALLGAVIEARLREDEALLHRMLADDSVSVRARLLHIVDLACDRQRDGATVMPALLSELDRVERDEHARRVIAGLTDQLEALLLREPECLRPDLREPEALRVALFVVSRGLRWAINEAVVDRPALLDDPRFRDELRRIVAGVLAVD